MCAVFSCTSSVLLRLCFPLLFPVFFTLPYLPWSGVGVFSSSYLLEPSVSPELPIYLSRPYLFNFWSFFWFKIKILLGIYLIHPLSKTSYQEVFRADNKRKYGQEYGGYHQYNSGIIINLWDGPCLFFFNTLLLFVFIFISLYSTIIFKSLLISLSLDHIRIVILGLFLFLCPWIVFSESKVPLQVFDQELIQGFPCYFQQLSKQSILKYTMVVLLWKYCEYRNFLTT